MGEIIDKKMDVGAKSFLEGNERIFWNLPDFNCDESIMLGQAIIALIGVNTPGWQSEDSRKEDLTTLLLEIAKFYKISPDDFYRNDILNNVLDPGYDYEIKTDLAFEVLSKKEA